jgi:hypothetical protein
VADWCGAVRTINSHARLRWVVGFSLCLNRVSVRLIENEGLGFVCNSVCITHSLLHSFGCICWEWGLLKTCLDFIDECDCEWTVLFLTLLRLMFIYIVYKNAVPAVQTCVHYKEWLDNAVMEIISYYEKQTEHLSTPCRHSKEFLSFKLPVVHIVTTRLLNVSRNCLSMWTVEWKYVHET